MGKKLLNGWKVTKMLLLNNMKAKEKNSKKNSNQSWLNFTKDKVDKCQTWEIWVAVICQTWEIWEAVAKETRVHKLMKLIDFNVEYNNITFFCFLFFVFFECI